MYRTIVRFIFIWGLLFLPSSLGWPEKEYGERQCYPPWEPVNGYYSIWGEGLLVEFGCNDGFTLVGDVVGACDSSIGLWTVNTPLCLGNNCKIPKIFPHGQVTIKHNGGILNFICESGYHLYGSRVLACDGDNWNVSVPTCLKNRGRYPSSFQEKLANAKRHRLQQSKSNATHLKESDNTCNSASLSPPKIPHAHVRANYHFDAEKKTYVMMATYTCKEGYKLKYPDMRHRYCKNKKWVGPIMPECIKNQSDCEKNNGGCDQICYILKGGYACACKEGYTLTQNRRNCIDVNECLFDNGNCHQDCFNTPGSFFCACSSGYYMFEGHCKDFDECTSDEGTACPGPCINTPGSYKCNCSIPGYKHSRNLHTCADVNECLVNNGGCEDKCENVRGSYKCRCEKKGYHLSADGHTCKDIDECKRYRKACRGGKCFNTVGSYVCRCNRHFRLSADKSRCHDIDECKENNGGCSMGCVNLIGSFKCSCPEKAYQMADDGFTCLDVNECEINNGGCSQNCTNTIGSYKCSCGEHGKVIAEDGHSCQSCPQNTYYLGSEKVCRKCPGNSHTKSKGHLTIKDCICNKGFEGNPSKGIECTDIDECNAPPNQTLGCVYGCVNTPGSALCTCPKGFVLQDNGKDCSDINECDMDNGGCQQICINFDGGHMCECHGPGFQLSENNHTCIVIHNWRNMPVGWRRRVHKPVDPVRHFFLDSPNLVRKKGHDIHECTLIGLNCTMFCEITEEGPQCTCPQGYSLAENKFDCDDIDECKHNNGGCEQICVNTHGSFRCDCNGGYRILFDEPSSCEEIDECKMNNGNCTHQCVNEIGSFHCECNNGYNLDHDGQTCLSPTCFDFKAPKHGRVVTKACQNPQKEDIFTGLKCRVECFSGYQIEGSEIRTCMKNGTWTGVTPTCTEINECQVKNGNCSQKCVNDEGSYHCECEFGYTLHTDRHTCLSKPCHGLVTPKFGKITPEQCLKTERKEIKPGTKCEIQCFPGYKLAGSTQRICQKNSTWSGNDPTCKEINECQVKNGNCSQKCVNDEGSYHCECEFGYTLHTDRHTCLSKPCSAIAILSFGKVAPPECLADEVETGTKCYFKCYKGYKLQGSFLRMCRENSTWSGVDSTCKEINECQVKNGNCSQKCVNDEGSYHCECEFGYTLHTDRHTCLSKPCHALVTPDFGKVLPPRCLYSDGSDLVAGTKCKVRCLKGYKIHGSKVRVCQENGTWSGKEVVCKVKGCPMLEGIPNGFTEPAECLQRRVHVLKFCQIKCRHGYRLVGEPITECLQTQKWSTELPKCERIEPVKGVVCPPDVHIILPKGKSSVPAIIPVVQGARSFMIIPDLNRFSFGNTKIKVIATSEETNEEVKCNYTVHVIDKEKPTVSKCTKIVRNIAWQKRSKLCWNEPVFTDNTGIQKISKTKKPGISNIRIGVQRIVYTAFDLQGNVAKCIFTLQVKAAICPKLERAANNQLYCKYNLDQVQICKAICNEGYVFPDETSTIIFICDPITKTWKPPHIKLMACIKM